MNAPTGYVALDLIGFTDKGDYDAATAYVKNDLVHYGASIWRCLLDDTTGHTPEAGDFWVLFVNIPVVEPGTSADIDAIIDGTWEDN